MSKVTKNKSQSQHNDTTLDLTWISIDQTVEDIPLNDSLVKSRKGNAEKRSLSSEDNDAVFSSLSDMLSSQYSFEVVLSCWIEKYSSEKEKGVMLLFQSLLSYCGMELQLSHSEIRAKNYESILEKLQSGPCNKCSFSSEKTREESKAIITNFLSVLIRKTKAHYLFDDYLLPNLIIFLVALSKIHLRHFRHIGTFIALKVIDVLLDIEKELRKMKQSYAKEVEDRIISITKAVDEIFSNVFAVRYRDVLSEIRMLCIDKLTQWLSFMPEKFLSVDFLKFIVWSLTDEVSAIRFNCLSTLLMVCVQNKISPEINCYLSSIEGLLFSRIYDVDAKVASLASCFLVEMERQVNLLILCNSAGFLETTYAKKICSLVFCNVLEIAISAGKLLMIQLSKSFYVGELTTAAENFSDDKKLLLAIAHYYANSEYKGRADLLVDSISESYAILWKLDHMAELLLIDKSSLLSLENAEQFFLGYRPDRSKKQKSHCLPAKLEDYPFDVNKLVSATASLIKKILKEVLDALNGVAKAQVNGSLESIFTCSMVSDATQELINLYLPKLKKKLVDLCKLRNVSEKEISEFLFSSQICSFLIRFMDCYDQTLWKFIDKALNKISRNIPFNLCVQLLHLQFVMLCWELRMIYTKELSQEERIEVAEKLKVHENSYLESVCYFFTLMSEGSNEILDIFIQWLTVRYDFSLDELGLVPLNKLQKGLFTNILNRWRLFPENVEKNHHLIVNISELFLKNCISVADAWILFCNYEKHNRETKDLLQKIMLKMAALDCYGFAKSLSQSLTTRFSEACSENISTVLDLANDFAKFLRINFHKTQMSEMASLIMKDGLIFAFTEASNRIKYLDILSTFGMLLSRTYQKSIVAFLEGLAGQEMMDRQCYGSLLESLSFSKSD
uniref:SCD domain-containing protein n=1 Tax=Syphacia muris TaxID=451379 RepID=A0A158R3Y3_9BILA